MLNRLPADITNVVISARPTASQYTDEQIAFAAVRTEAEAQAVAKTFRELAGEGVYVTTYSRVGYLTAVVDGRLI